MLRRAGFLLLAIGLLAYPLDWAVWKLRVSLGSGMDSVLVNKIVAATLKGNKFEVYSEQMTPVDCSRSVLPQAGAGPCWWLRRHPQIIQQY